MISDKKMWKQILADYRLAKSSGECPRLAKAMVSTAAYYMTYEECVKEFGEKKAKRLWEMR